MKNKIRRNMTAGFAVFAIIAAVAFSGCKKDDDDSPPDAQKTTYTLKVKDVLGVSGTLTIAEKSSGSTESILTILLTGAPVGVHPAHIHMNSAVETGAIAYSLNDVDQAGMSTTLLNVSYATLVNFDGYVNVHLDAATLGTIIAQADIGGNVITSDHKTYTLNQDSASGISGTTLFEKRKNGNTLVTVDLSAGGTLPTGYYPVHINLGSVATVGIPVIRKTLNPVDGTTKMSYTNIRTLNDGTAINYANWLVYDGFMTIHDAIDSTDVIALGNIGSN